MIPMLQTSLVVVSVINHLSDIDLSGIDFSCTCSVGLRSLIHKDSAIFRFLSSLLKFISMILKSGVLISL